jgi:hypothetical protein
MRSFTLYDPPSVNITGVLEDLPPRSWSALRGMGNCRTGAQPNTAYRVGDVPRNSVLLMQRSLFGDSGSATLNSQK